MTPRRWPVIRHLRWALEVVRYRSWWNRRGYLYYSKFGQPVYYMDRMEEIWRGEA